MFCSLFLAEHGMPPVIFERGDSVENRIPAVERFLKNGILDPESNIQFGSGGAGTFSDGKLMTRIHDPYASYVLEKLIEFGADPAIAYQAKPHIGTDVLRILVSRIEKRVREL
ncbi:MAG: hypothetical protein II797_04160, partial [Clostridia bacterium]|nr:hypothetical protein [Clostridia bacterium]